jgi:rare lipoprotein A (peptidoglycan hydrolase)
VGDEIVRFHRYINPLAAHQSVIVAFVFITLFSLLPNPGPIVAKAANAIASWYDCAKPGECSRNKITASGERFSPNAMTAAHRSLPFGTLVRVTHKRRSVVVRINDRGPFIRGRHIDLSKAAARRIGCPGVCRVSMVVVGKRRAR